MLASTKRAIPVNDLTPGQKYTFPGSCFRETGSPIGAPQPNGCSNGTIISGSSVIGDSCETSISIPPAIKLVNDSILSDTETIITATSAIASVPETTTPLVHTIIDRTAASIFG